MLLGYALRQTGDIDAIEFTGTLGWARADKANGSPLNPYHHSDTIIINKESDLFGAASPLQKKHLYIFDTELYVYNASME